MEPGGGTAVEVAKVLLAAGSLAASFADVSLLAGSVLPGVGDLLASALGSDLGASLLVDDGVVVDGGAVVGADVLVVAGGDSAVFGAGAGGCVAAGGFSEGAVPAALPGPAGR